MGRRASGTAHHGIVGQLRHDTRGNAIVEFALVAAPLFALIIAIIQTGLMFFGQQLLETVAERAARILTTGAAQQSGMTAAQFKSAVCSKLPALMDCGSAFVDVQSATSFAATATTRPTPTFDANGNLTTAWAFNPGSPGNIVIVRVMYLWPVAPGPLGFNLANAGSNRRLLVSTMVFKTEPYAG